MDHPIIMTLNIVRIPPAKINRFIPIYPTILFEMVMRPAFLLTDVALNSTSSPWEESDGPGFRPNVKKCKLNYKRLRSLVYKTMELTRKYEMTEYAANLGLLYNACK